MSFNRCVLVGNLTKDPELKKTQSGVSVCSFKIAVNRRFQKEGQQETDFFEIVAWRNTAEFVSRYFHKGKPILVCGQLQTRSWTDQNGQKRYTTEVVADEATFVENKSNDAPSEAPHYSSYQSGFEELSSEEELPF